ncbi:hypothetical protein KAU11_08295 [Candidatus Babeliales bacterium]|nr:hypothetical protein [Candidatus Babeliales bacterium]
MAQSLASFTPVKYSLKLVELLYNDTIYTSVTNTSHEGEIKNAGDRVRIRTAAKITLSAYTKGMTLVAQDLNPTDEDLIIDQLNYFKFIVDDVDKIQNDIDTINTYASGAKMSMSELIDTNILDYARKNVAGANAVGTDYTTGTIGVTATTGVVAGTGTTFTAAMVGGYFTPDAGVTYYLVTAFTSTTSITVVDLDGIAYTGGTIATSTTYTIAAATAIALTKSNVYQYLVQLGTVMSQSLTPRDGRFIVVNAAFEGILRQAPEFIPAVETAYNEVVKKGMIGKIAGFEVFFSELVAGNSSTGFWFWAGTKGFMSFAAQILKTSVIPSESDPNTFVSTAKGLLVFGRKVCEGDRGRGSVLRGTIA